MTVRAMVGDEVVAESERVVWVEGNAYFPRTAIAKGVLRESDKRTQCHWKGEATYYDVVSGEEVLSDAAWSYPRPMRKAKHLQNRVAFTGRVRVASPGVGEQSGIIGWLRAALLGR